MFVAPFWSPSIFTIRPFSCNFLGNFLYYMFNDHNRHRNQLEKCISHNIGKFVWISDTKKLEHNRVIVFAWSVTHRWFCRSQLWGSSIRDAELDEIESILHILALATCVGRFSNCFLSSEIPLKQVHKGRSLFFWRGGGDEKYWKQFFQKYKNPNKLSAPHKEFFNRKMYAKK